MMAVLTTDAYSRFTKWFTDISIHVLLLKYYKKNRTKGMVWWNGFFNAGKKSACYQ